MIIAIPVNESNVNTEVCPSFGRTPYFMLYETESENVKFLNNSAAAASGGAGIKAAQSIADCKVQAVITPRCGENAANVLFGANIALYKSELKTAMENVELFKEKKLNALSSIHSGFNNHEN